MKIPSFTYQREAYVIAGIHYGLPILGGLLILVLWIFGWLSGGPNP